MVVAGVHEDLLGVVLQLLQCGRHGAVDFLLRGLLSEFQLGVIVQCSAVLYSTVQCRALQNLEISMEEEIAGGQVWGVWCPVLALHWPAREDPGTQDAIEEGVVGSVE